MKIFLLFIMLFLHIVDDYYLQGILANLKQKLWWEEHAPDPLYKNDYIIALLTHAFSWTFMILLPYMVIMILTNNIGITDITGYLVLFTVNMIIHSWVDNLKANERIINLLADQIIHVLQIISTWAVISFDWGWGING